MFALTPFRRRSLAGEYDPFREFENLERRFFGSYVAPDLRIDISEKEECYVLEADLPGFSKEDIHIDLEGAYMTVRAERSSPKNEDEQNGRYLRSERVFGAVERTFELSGVDTDRLQATYDNGVLTVRMPKKTVESRKKTLPID